MDTCDVTCVGHRVDALVLGYRVTFAPSFLDTLEARHKLSSRYGRARLTYAPARLVGEMRFSRARKVYDITCDGFRLHVDLHAAGAVERVDGMGEPCDEAGWTLEIVWSAQRLAEWGLDRALDESDALVKRLGEDVHERALRRLDLCADMAGWAIRPGDEDAIVKRPRAKKDKTTEPSELDTLGLSDDEKYRIRAEAARKEVARMLREEARKVEEGELMPAASTHETGRPGHRKVCGISVGRGGALMLRIYDKRLELSTKWDAHDSEKREAEEARWRLGGWDGEAPVTRVEFQIRGQVVRELGIRDPSQVLGPRFELDSKGKARAVDQEPLRHESGRPVTLVDRLPWLWATMLDWVRLVVPDPSQRFASRLADDSRWAALRHVRFGLVEASGPIVRVRKRKNVSEAQTLGVMLSIAGKAGTLATLEENQEWSEDKKAYVDSPAETILRNRIRGIAFDSAERLVTWLLEKTGGDAIEANVHLAVRMHAALARNTSWEGLLGPAYRMNPPMRKGAASVAAVSAPGHG